MSIVITQESLRNTLAVFSTLLKNHAHRTPYNIWRYIGTGDGIFLTDHRMPFHYDHLKRPWFVQTRNNKGLLTISTPYKDATTDQLIITLGKTLFLGEWVFSFV